MFIDKLERSELAMFYRILISADGTGESKLTTGKIARDIGMYKDKNNGGQLRKVKPVHVNTILNHLVSHGILIATDDNGMRGNAKYRLPLKIDPKYFILKRGANPDEVEILKGKIEALLEKLRLKEEQAKKYRIDIENLKPYRDKVIEMEAQTAESLERYTSIEGKSESELANSRRMKLIIAWLTVMDVDQYFYEADNSKKALDEAGGAQIRPMFTLFATWMKTVGFETVIAVLEKLVAYDLPRKLCPGEEKDFLKVQNAIHRYIFGALRSAKKEGLKGNKRYGRRTGKDGQAFT